MGRLRAVTQFPSADSSEDLPVFWRTFAGPGEDGALPQFGERRSWKCRKVVALEVRDEGLEGFWGDDANVFAPHVKVPRHFEMTRCMKAHHNGAIRVFRDMLSGMETELSCRVCGSLRKLPYHFTVLLRIVKRPKGFCGVIGEREFSSPCKGFGKDRGLYDSIQSEVP